MHENRSLQTSKLKPSTVALKHYTTSSQHLSLSEPFDKPPPLIREHYCVLLVVVIAGGVVYPRKLRLPRVLQQNEQHWTSRTVLLAAAFQH